MSIKSEKLKKLEVELADLEQWKKLGLVPKKDIEKHQDEIRIIRDKITEEVERLRFVKESGEGEEYIAPKRPPSRPAYAEPQTLPEMEMNSDSMTEAGLDMETEAFESETSAGEEGEGKGEDATVLEEADEEDPFSDRNRWKRGILEDPDADAW